MDRYDIMGNNSCSDKQTFFFYYISLPVPWKNHGNFTAALIIFFCVSNLEFISKYLMLLSCVRKNSAF